MCYHRPMNATPPTPSDIESMIRRLYRATGATAFFDEPIVRYADAADPFFQTFRSTIGDFHPKNRSWPLCA